MICGAWVCNLDVKHELQWQQRLQQSTYQPVIRMNTGSWVNAQTPFFCLRTVSKHNARKQSRSGRIARYASHTQIGICSDARIAKMQGGACAWTQSTTRSITLADLGRSLCKALNEVRGRANHCSPLSLCRHQKELRQQLSCNVRRSAAVRLACSASTCFLCVLRPVPLGEEGDKNSLREPRLE